MPEFKMECGKCPFDVICSKTGLDAGIFRHITIIVEVNKIMPQHLAIDNDNSYYSTAPRVRVYSTVGSGDAMLAGMVAACLRHWDAQAMLRFGVICGSATASHAGTELFSRSEVEATEYDLTLRPLNI